MMRRQRLHAHAARTRLRGQRRRRNTRSSSSSGTSCSVAGDGAEISLRSPILATGNPRPRGAMLWRRRGMPSDFILFERKKKRTSWASRWRPNNAIQGGTRLQAARHGLSTSSRTLVPSHSRLTVSSPARPRHQQRRSSRPRRSPAGARSLAAQEAPASPSRPPACPPPALCASPAAPLAPPGRPPAPGAPARLPPPGRPPQSQRQPLPVSHLPVSAATSQPLEVSMAETAGDETPPLPSSSGAEESSLLSSPPSPTATNGDKPPPRTRKPGTKRLVLTASVLVSFLVGLPLLLKSTEIHRSPLPSDAIADLSRRLQSHPPSFPCSLHAVFLRSSPGSSVASLADQLERAISTQHHLLPASSTAGNISVSVTVQSDGGCTSSTAVASPWGCGAVTAADSVHVDNVFDELLHSALGGGDGDGMKVYTIVIAENDDGKGTRVVIGKHRHAWVVGKVDEAEAVSLIGKVFIKYFMNGGIEEGETGIGKGEFMPVGSDGNVVLSFSLLNADPNDWVYDWEFKNIAERILTPVVEALQPIADINIESQVLYHTPKSSYSYSNDKLGGNVLSMGDIPFFVNSNEWHLDTSISATGRSKVLQFVVYIPSARECPLYLQLPDGELSKTNAFISPMWGGVVIWNPPGCSLGSKKTHGTRRQMSSHELMEALEIFIGQLRQLFGLKPNYHAQGMDVATKFLVSEKGFAQWELDLLYRHHACSNLLSCVATLESLSSLVQSLPRMIVMDEIGRQVELSLEAASLAQRNATLGIGDSSAVSATRARALAEDAFFHPSIMSISYASVEHYFAIYMPFFAPVCLHVLLAAIKELKRYKVERAKYSAFLASQSQATTS